MRKSHFSYPNFICCYPQSSTEIGTAARIDITHACSLPDSSTSLKLPSSYQLLSQDKNASSCSSSVNIKQTALLNPKDNCPLCISDWSKTVLQGTINLQNQFFVRRLNFSCLRNGGAGLVITVWWGSLWIHCPRECFLLITSITNPRSFFDFEKICCLIYCVKNLKLSGVRRLALGFHCISREGVDIPFSPGRQSKNPSLF